MGCASCRVSKLVRLMVANALESKMPHNCGMESDIRQVPRKLIKGAALII